MIPAGSASRGAILALAVGVLSYGAVTHAGGTRLWEIAGYEELDKGQMENTAVSSRGEVSLGLGPTAVDLEGVGLVWSGVRGPGGAIYLGTGYDGRIFRIDGGTATLIANTGQLIVTALAFDAKGDLYASSLPDAVIWRIPSPGKIKAGAPVEARRWAALPAEAKHVWALAFDEEGRDLYAGTGPGGVIYAIGSDAKADVYVDTDEEHVLCLLRRSGKLLAGTSPGALLLEVSGPGRVTSLSDFDATEVKAIAADGTRLLVAVNRFGSPPPVPTKPAVLPLPGLAQAAPPSTSKTPKLGEGAVHALTSTGQDELLWSNAKAHILSMAVDGAGRVYAGLASEGKIVSVDTSRLARTEIDLDEREVMVLLAGETLSFAATGDAGAAYLVAHAREGEARYLSAPLDAGTTARWGRLTWFGSGKLAVEARSGNTLTPDKSWSDWSKPIGDGKMVDRPAARYLQLRVSWARDAAAVFRGAQLAFAPVNRRAIITELNPDSPFFDVGKGKSAKSADVVPSTRAISTRPTKKNSMELELEWKVENPDGDTLRYRLYYRAVREKVWRPILREDEVLTKTKHKWSTESVPEGMYVVRLVADDSPDNDPKDVLSDEYVSVPVLVDNHQPAVNGLSYDGKRLKGEARDSFSAISAIELSIDAGPWIPVSCADGIFDSPVEKLDFALPSKLAAGPHAIAVRAYDRAGNIGTAEIHVDEK